MYTSKDIAEAIEKIPADDLDLTAIAWCDLHDRTGLSEEAVRGDALREGGAARPPSAGLSPNRLRNRTSEARTANLRWTKAMTEAANIERQKRRQAEFVNDEQQRLIEIEDMRLAVKFGDKRRYSDREREAIRQELVAAGLDDVARRDPDAVEAVFKKLNAVDEVIKARALIMGR